jgi:Asp-tRNA(Asn)/Glu-tRNA(Gln) amidotransferase A subunit family amidase
MQGLPQRANTYQQSMQPKCKGNPGADTDRHRDAGGSSGASRVTCASQLVALACGPENKYSPQQESTK